VSLDLWLCHSNLYPHLYLASPLCLPSFLFIGLGVRQDSLGQSHLKILTLITFSKTLVPKSSQS
jgi:hypothetical protein